MYPVNSTFHTLSIQDAPKTRVRIYFIGEGVDCTDDVAVQTSGTLLVGAVGDTDSNGRIGQNGISFTEMFNPDKNIQIGTAVSYQIGMTLLNTDGALNGFSYGRCKVYLDVYDAANSAWRACPMGVFIIDIPTKRRVQLVSATGYDQMQLLDTICDTWWSGLNWSGGLTLLQILNSMAAQRGVFVSANTASALVNSSVTYTEPPFSCVEVTYREVLEYIAEATGTIARFDRDGYLDLRFFSTAQISGSTVTINADTVGNTCLDIDIAEYQAAAIDLLKVKIAEDDIGVTVGSGTNQYTIVNNLFLYGSTATIITNRATPIYNRLNGLGAYTPLQAKLIYDWSLEAGDIINIVRDSTTYPVLIFQQTLSWRGGYVTADILADGDNVRPVMDYDERVSYRMSSEISKKVGDNEIISKINQTAESIQIQASRVDLAGYVTFTNLSTSGQTTIDGGNITTGTIDASTVTVNNINASNISSGTLSADRIAAGSLAIGKLDTSAQNTINGANKQEQLIYRSKAAGTTSLSKTTTWVTNTNGSQDTWTLKRPTYNSSYPVLFIATQRKDVGGTVTCTTPQIDNTTTVIDGGHITTGTIDASVVSVTNLNASNITSGTMSASKISGGTLTLGGSNNTNGTMTVKDANGNTAATVGNTGITVNGTQTIGGSSKQTTLVLSDGSIVSQTNGENSFKVGRNSLGGGSLLIYKEISGVGGNLTNDGITFIDGTKAKIRYDYKGFIIRYDNGYGVVDSPAVQMYHDSTESRITFATPPGDSGYPTTIGSAGSTFGANATFSANATVNGVLDVTPRRCYARLSGEGWYRVCKFDFATYGEAIGAAGGVLHLSIVDSYGTNANDAHTIDLLFAHNKIAFANESSVGNHLNVDKIRYTFNGASPYDGFVDIHWAGGTSYVGVSFDYAGIAVVRQAGLTAMGLVGVDPSPSGETVLKEYTFAENTNGDVTNSFLTSKGNVYAYRSGDMVTVTFVGNSTTWPEDEVFMTIADGIRPALSIDAVAYIGRQAVLVRINQNGNIVLWVGSTLTGNQRLYFSATYPILH